MANLKYLPLKECREIDLEEKKRLQKQQDMITSARAERENRIRSYPEYWKFIERSIWHERFKHQIRLVDDK